MKRLGSAATVAVALTLAAVGCDRDADPPAPQESDAAAGLAAIAEAVDANHVQALAASSTADGFEVIALMVADGPSGPWAWDAATGEVTEADQGFSRGPQLPTDTATMSQALAAVEGCAEGPMELSASALGADLVWVQQGCGSGNDKEWHQYLDGSPVDTTQMDLTDADGLATAFDYATRALGDQQIVDVQVDYGKNGGLRVTGTEWVDSTEGEPNACLPQYVFAVGNADSQPLWRVNCLEGIRGAPVIDVPFDPAVAASVYEEASAEGEPTTLAYNFQDDALVYTVLVDDRARLRFDPQGVPLD